MSELLRRSNHRHTAMQLASETCFIMAIEAIDYCLHKKNASPPTGTCNVAKAKIRQHQKHTNSKKMLVKCKWIPWCFRIPTKILRFFKGSEGIRLESVLQAPRWSLKIHHSPFYFRTLADPKTQRFSWKLTPNSPSLFNQALVARLSLVARLALVMLQTPQHDGWDDDTLTKLAAGNKFLRLLKVFCTSRNCHLAPFFEMAVACWFGRWNFWEHRHPQNFQRKGIPSWTVGWGSGGIRESPRIIEKTPNGRAPHLFVRRRKLLPISGRKHGVARERNYTWESPNPINCLNLMWRWSEKKRANLFRKWWFNIDVLS